MDNTTKKLITALSALLASEVSANDLPHPESISNTSFKLIKLFMFFGDKLGDILDEATDEGLDEISSDMPQAGAHLMAHVALAARIVFDIVGNESFDSAAGIKEVEAQTEKMLAEHEKQASELH